MTRPRDLVRRWMEDAQRHLPGVLVLTLVLVLLRGPSGTVEAMRLQLETFFGSFLGTGDGLGAVVVHTLPLALAAAVATLLVVRRVITFESFSSVVALSAIVVCGASIGGFARDVMSTSQPIVRSAGIKFDTSSVKGTEPAQPGVVRVGVQPKSVSAPLGMAVAKVETPMDRLRSIDWLAEPRFTPATREPIDPLDIFPESGGVVGFVTKAINQLLGYLVAYQPRLFLAAIIAGGWMGWTLHRRLDAMGEVGPEDREVATAPDEEIELKRAA